MDFKRAYIYTLILILFIAAGFAGGYLFKSISGSKTPEWRILNQAYTLIRDHGWKDLPEDSNLEYGMIRGLIQSYDDPYTTFIEPVQHELESNTLEGSFGGIGVQLGRDKDGNVVLYPIPDGPAEKAGVQEGDNLIYVEDQQITSDLPIETVIAALRGPVGQWVKIGVTRPPDLTSIEYRIKRAEIPLPSVTWHLDPDESRLGIIEVNVVAASTPEEIQKAVEDLKTRGAEAFVLDLRDNYGGLLTAGVDTARLFLDKGDIIQQQYKGKPVETFSVERPGTLVGIPLAVLVNENTASAAEIIAGVIKVHHRGALIGANTYGKDTIQLVYELEDGSSLHVTAAKWWIPGLVPPLEGTGIQPDITVETAESGEPDQAIRVAAQLLLKTNSP